MTVFLDTVGLLALWDEADQWHAAAAQAYSLIKQARATLVTSTYILLECGNASARRPYRNEVNLLRLKLEEHRSVVDPTPAEWQQAWRAFERREAGGAGIVDQFSFLVMRRLGIKQVFSNDEHFRAAGFGTLF